MARASGGTGAGRYHHGDLRRALVAAALEMLEGGEEVTLRAVARRAGVSHAAPYHHFADRRALVAAVAEEGLVGLRDALRAGREAGGADAARRLLETGVAYVRYAVANPAHYWTMFSGELADRAELPGLQTAYAEAYGVLLEAVGEVLGARAPRAMVEGMALGSWSTVHGLSLLILDNQVGGEWKEAEAAAWLARRVLTGSRPPGG